MYIYIYIHTRIFSSFLDCSFTEGHSFSIVPWSLSQRRTVHIVTTHIYLKFLSILQWLYVTVYKPIFNVISHVDVSPLESVGELSLSLSLYLFQCAHISAL